MRILSSPRIVPRFQMASLPGLAICALVSILAFAVCETGMLKDIGIGPLVMAMALGMVAGNAGLDRVAPACNPGLAFAKQKLLRFGIILYGTRLTFHDIAEVGMSGVLIDVTMVASTLVLALLIGTAVLKLERDIAILVGAGSAICGAAAVLATTPVLKARPEFASVAVATVVLFGTIATFLYPMLYRLGCGALCTPDAFGIYAGSTIHEVAQVIAAARSADAVAVDTAVIAKMVRVMLLCPFLACLAICIVGRSGARHVDARTMLQAMPWFAVFFIAVIALNSLLSIPAPIARLVEAFDTVLLAMAMAALGMTTRISALRQAGVRPIILGGVLFAWLVAGGAAVNSLVPALLQ